VKLLGYVDAGARRIGAVEDDIVRDLGTTAEFYADVDAALARSESETVSLSQLEQAPPVPETARIFCVGMNYRSHVAELAGKIDAGPEEYPTIFGRWPQTLVCDGAAVPIPPNEDGLDWEGELAAVIGRRAWQASETDALDHVLGYAVFNDLSARKKQVQTSQMTLGKNADCSGPISWVTTADEVGDPEADLKLTTHVNGELMQSGVTGDLIHSLASVIAYITDTVTLEPGDVIATGTPSGVGISRQPPRLLQPGDLCVVAIEKVGSVSARFVAR
jgi:2,4-didehydro-3-deoxy-L-rhamnonate hydrolase